MNRIELQSGIIIMYETGFTTINIDEYKHTSILTYRGDKPTIIYPPVREKIIVHKYEVPEKTDIILMLLGAVLLVFLLYLWKLILG